MPFSCLTDIAVTVAATFTTPFETPPSHTTPSPTIPTHHTTSTPLKYEIRPLPYISRELETLPTL